MNALSMMVLYALSGFGALVFLVAVAGVAWLVRRLLSEDVWLRIVCMNDEEGKDDGK